MAERLDERAILATLEAGGAVAARLTTYEPRKAQLDLMKLVIRGFNESALVAAEAGTGVGKSFAYLLPALRYALLNKERIIVSTATITLQEQLFQKDIPLVLAALGADLTVVLMKGRGNYLCRRRLADALREQVLFTDEENEALADISNWAEKSLTGERSDLPFMPPESVWFQVASESDLCMAGRCPEHEGCFFQAMRQKAAQADVLVVNHHLLLADAAARHEGAGYEVAVVLPPYSRIVVDEAHTMEEAATSFFSERFSRLGIFRQVGRLYRTRRATRRGLLLSLIPPLGAKEMLDGIEMVTQKLRESAVALDGAALHLCGKELAFRLTPAGHAAIKKTLFPALANLRDQLLDYAAIIHTLLGKDKTDDKAVDPITWEIKAIRRWLESTATLCLMFIDYQKHPEHILWLERHNSKGKGDGDPWFAFTMTPLTVAPILKQAVFEVNKTVVCLSATLTVAGAFDYWSSRCGFNESDEREVFFGKFPSPFPYAKSVLLAIPDDAPLPGEDAYRDFVNDAVTRLIASAGGSALILFTSYEALKSAHAAALPTLEKRHIRCLKQGDDDRSRLLQTFVNEESSVLFATDSFWEGVDAPGDTLRLVILCRLPFKMPNDPVFAARCEDIDKRGGNSFMECSVPESVMKFKQGFGRLMRRSSDRGVVVVLDARILRKRYGLIFLNSLPKTKTLFSELDRIDKSTKRFLSP
ncbi:MAG: ATP-dependent DNA helicase [Treponema sp.]|jgi:ATP-dependent DNA helicase DinG|nr:ATP-dependent DNA helicase [Treponema sp.]